MLTGAILFMAISNLSFQNMYAASGGASNNINFGGQQQQYHPVSDENANIFASSSVGGVNSGNAGFNRVNGVSKTEGAAGLVDRLDRMDSGILKPQAQDEYRANHLDLYA